MRKKLSEEWLCAWLCAKKKDTKADHIGGVSQFPIDILAVLWIETKMPREAV
jgi:hypothetical protein